MHFIGQLPLLRLPTVPTGGGERLSAMQLRSEHNRPLARAHLRKKIKDLEGGKRELTLGGALSDVSGTTDPTQLVETLQGSVREKSPEKMFGEGSLFETQTTVCVTSIGDLREVDQSDFPLSQVSGLGRAETLPTLW